MVYLLLVELLGLLVAIALNLTFALLWAGAEHPSKVGKLLLWATTAGLGGLTYLWAHDAIAILNVYLPI